MTLSYIIYHSTKWNTQLAMKYCCCTCYRFWKLFLSYLLLFLYEVKHLLWHWMSTAVGPWPLDIFPGTLLSFKLFAHLIMLLLHDWVITLLKALYYCVAGIPQNKRSSPQRVKGQLFLVLLGQSCCASTYFPNLFFILSSFCNLFSNFFFYPLKFWVPSSYFYKIFIMYF